MIDKKMYETRLLEWTLQRLFGETSYHVERSPCRGKFRGHNDYSIVFGSGRKLFIGQDQRNYLNGLRKQVGLIQHFRDHQAENTEKIKAALAAHNTPFCDAAVEIVPYTGSTDLVVYGVVILTHQSGAQLLYRETAMHFYQEQFQYLRKNRIETAAQLSMQYDAIQAEMDALTERRGELYRQKRRGDGGGEIQAEIEQITTHLRALRRDLKLCARIEGDIPKVRAAVEAQRPDHVRRRPYEKTAPRGPDRHSGIDTALSAHRGREP